jgi:hypothetical protein
MLLSTSRISILTSTYGEGAGVVDSRDGDAANKVRMLFNARRSAGLANNIVVCIPKNNAPESFQVMNFLRQAHASGLRIPVMGLFVNDSSNPQGYIVKMKDVYITSYQTGGDAEALSLNYTKIMFKYTPQDGGRDL